jgi:hypothetical protein
MRKEGGKEGRRRDRAREEQERKWKVGVDLQL